MNMGTVIKYVGVEYISGGRNFFGAEGGGVIKKLAIENSAGEATEQFSGEATEQFSGVRGRGFVGWVRHKLLFLKICSRCAEKVLRRKKGAPTFLILCFLKSFGLLD